MSVGKLLRSPALNCQALMVWSLLSFFFLCSAAIITAYLMKTEQLSLEGLNTSTFYLEHFGSADWLMLMAFIVYFLKIWWLFCLTTIKIRVVVSLNFELFNISSFSLFIFSLCVPADALESLRRSCESVCPNDGFLEQVCKGPKKPIWLLGCINGDSETLVSNVIVIDLNSFSPIAVENVWGNGVQGWSC